MSNYEQNQQSGITPEQMPPLEPTAEVPPIHSDTLNDPAYWNKKFDDESARVPREHRDDKDQKSGLKKVIAGVAGTAVLAVGGFVGVKALGGGENSASNPEQTSSAPANPGENPTSQENLENLDTKATPEQIQWVIDNPVRASEYPSAEEQLEALSVRMNIIDNSAELDFKKPVGENGHTQFTDRFQPTFDAMVESVYDKTSSGYDTLYAASTKVAQNTGEFLQLGNDIHTTITPIEGTGVVEGNTATVLGVIDTVSRSNPSFVEGPGMRVAFTLKTDEDGVVRIEHTKEQE